MKKQDFLALEVGAKIVHKHYGVCTVTGEMLTLEAKIICPDTQEGKILLAANSGSIVPDLLECSYKLCQKEN